MEFDRLVVATRNRDKFGEIAHILSDLPLELLPLSGALALSAGLCALGFGLQAWVGIRGTGILIVTALMVLLATVAPQRIAPLAGAERVGVFLMQIFFAAIGASANIAIVLERGPVLFLFAGLILLAGSARSGKTQTLLSLAGAASREDLVCMCAQDRIDILSKALVKGMSHKVFANYLKSAGLSVKESVAGHKVWDANIKREYAKAKEAVEKLGFK